jgi:pimeloyl-ACP methyl ester carboxylesterase
VDGLVNDAVSGPREGVIRLPDGRPFGYQLGGLEGGAPVLMLHGTPGSRFKFATTDAPARALGQRIVALDRWGYGHTDPHAAPALDAFAADIADVMDQLGMRTFAVMGVSGGGPYAAAVAAILKDRVIALALVSPVGPMAGMRYGRAVTPFHKFCFHVLPRIPGGTRGVFSAFRQAVNRRPGVSCWITSVRAPEADRKILGDGATAQRLLNTFREGLRPGAHGPAIDLRLFARPWPFDLGAIRCPSKVWIGANDRNVPVAAAEKLAALIPNAHFERLPDAGHLWVAHHYPDVLRWIANAGIHPK